MSTHTWARLHPPTNVPRSSCVARRRRAMGTQPPRDTGVVGAHAMCARRKQPQELMSLCTLGARGKNRAPGLGVNYFLVNIN